LAGLLLIVAGTGLIAALIRNDCFCARARTSVDHRSGLRAVTDAERRAKRFDGSKEVN
jgi:hypothetical protein